jgi:16S rRNA (guanine527-N7)-methyltransferase
MPDAERSQLNRLAEWIGTPIDEDQSAALFEYASWLREEALPAGGLGPGEGPRIWDRHICDSLAFAIGWPNEAPATALDVGSGVGLPGIPLAILWPGTDWMLLDRAQGRVNLARRAVRVLELGNVAAIQVDVDRHRARYDGIVARGVMQPAILASKVARMLSPAGKLVIGVSRTINEEREVPTGSRTHRVPTEVLDGGAEILIIEPRER